MTFDPVVYALEAPPYHRVVFDARNAFSGWAFYYGDKVIRRVRVSRLGEEIGGGGVTLPREDIARHVPRLTGARRCGFRFDLHVDAGVAPYDFEIVYADGSSEPFLSYDVPGALRNRERFARMSAVLDAIPAPDPDLVYATQGHHRVSLYRDSSLSCAMGVMTYLGEAGLAVADGMRVLDFGCGTGRLLLGWRAWDPAARLFGCEVNSRLSAWAHRNLPDDLDLRRTGFHPPLPYPDGQFDVLCVISVFTHLSLASQRAWVSEFRRVLKPGGRVVITLHGELYARHSCRDDTERFGAFQRDGYLERPHPVEGSNGFAAFHGEDFARRLFEGFAPRGYFPNGHVGGRRNPFPIAQAQDVYVFSSDRIGPAGELSDSAAP